MIGLRRIEQEPSFVRDVVSSSAHLVLLVKVVVWFSMFDEPITHRAIGHKDGIRWAKGVRRITR